MFGLRQQQGSSAAAAAAAAAACMLKMLLPAACACMQIMGVGYYKQVTQWSKGEYTGANQVSCSLP
jgi:di/tricarboxylate transporter